jgi:hypothetical protein
METKKLQSQKIYEELKARGLSDAEIAESFVFPGDWLTENERKEAAEALGKFREEHQANMTEQEKEEIEEFVKKLKNQTDI